MRWPLFSLKKKLNSVFVMQPSCFDCRLLKRFPLVFQVVSFYFVFSILSVTNFKAHGAGLSVAISCNFSEIFLKKDQLEGAFIDSYQRARDLSATIDQRLVNSDLELGVARARLELPKFEEAWLELSFYRLFFKLKDQPPDLLFKHFQKLFDLQRESIRRRELKIDQTSEFISGRYEFTESEARMVWGALVTSQIDAVVFEDSSLWPREIVGFMIGRMKDRQENEWSVFDIPFCCGHGNSQKCKLCPVGRGLIAPPPKKVSVRK